MHLFGDGKNQVNNVAGFVPADALFHP